MAEPVSQVVAQMPLGRFLALMAFFFLAAFADALPRRVLKAP